VWGYAGSTPGSYGVAGYSDYTGVSGRSINGWGVWAWSWNGWGLEAYSWNGFAVHAESVTNSGVVGLAGGSSSGWFHFPTIAGVVGIAGDQGPALSQAPKIGKNINPPTAGVSGTADQSPGVIGTSNAAIGVYGFSNGNSGVVGETVDGFAGGYFTCTNPNPMHWAGYFDGPVHITGNLTVDGPMKGAVARFPDGTQRALYCMESPEPWFEDFGASKLKRGRVVVVLDANFAKVITRGDYRVFLTPEGDCRGLYVRRKSAASFEVRELMGGKSSIPFSYRILGRRKDAKGQRRFAKIDTRLPVPPRPRPARPTRAKTSSPTPAELRAFAARMQKDLQAQMLKRGRKGKGS
jgi:hypothetical protein